MTDKENLNDETSENEEEKDQVHESEDLEKSCEDEDIEISEDHVEDEIEDLKNSLIRLQADFNNYRTRSQKEKAETIKNASADLISEILPVLDNFERAFIAVEEADINPEILEGFKLIEKELINILKAQGLEKIDSDGKEFDPNFHQAVVTEKSDEGSGIILETLQKGYMLNEKVLRPSIVKVSE